MPFLLPHEVVSQIANRSDIDTLLCRDGWDPAGLRHLARAEKEIGCTPGKMLGVGLWMDGVSFGWDKKASLEVFSMSLPGLAGRSRSLRIPITCIEKKYLMKGKTVDDILEVVRDSFICLASGCNMETRMDRQPWRKSDKARSRKQGSALGLQGVLAAMTADWAAYKSAMRFPQHNETAGFCWRCAITPAELKQVSSAANWRQQRLGHWQVLHRIIEQGRSISPLMGAPAFRCDICRIDWLHTADLGVSADFLGLLFHYILGKKPEATLKERVGHLYQEINAWYKANKVEDRLDQLTVNMIYPKGSTTSSPILKGSAAEIRALIPFAKDAALQQLDDADPVEDTIRAAIVDLAACYDCLSSDHPFSADLLAKHSLRFSLLCVALEDSTDNWHVKPKLHLFQEMCEMHEDLGERPSAFWTYRDESFGGSVARLARTRGRNTASSVAKSMLQKFMAKHLLPRLEGEAAL